MNGIAAPWVVALGASAPADADFGSMAGLLTLVFGVIFVGWLVGLGVREYRRTKRRTRAAAAGDPHTVLVPELGATMADGGEPTDDAA